MKRNERKKDVKEKNGGKTISSSSFHYFEQNDQYRIERPSVITGGLKINEGGKTMRKKQKRRAKASASSRSTKEL